MQAKYLNNFKYSLYNNKWKLLVFICFFVFGFALGIFLAISSYENCFLFRIEDLAIIKILTGRSSSFATFFNRIFAFIIVYLIIFLCSLNKYLVCINVIINIYRAYILGFVLTYIIGVCSVHGVIIVCLILLPIQLISNLIIIYMSALSFDQSLYKCGKTNNNGLFLKFLLLSFILLIILDLVECILLFVISPTVIFVI